MDTGLTTIPEADIEKHRAAAQSMITRVVVLEDSSGQILARRSPAPDGASCPRSRPAPCARRARSSLTKTVASVRPDDQLLSIPQHTLLYRARAASRSRSRSPTSSPAPASWKAWQPRTPARRSKATRPRASRSFCRRRPTSAAFAFASYLLQLIDADGEAPNDIKEPDFLFDTPQDALKSMVAGLDGALLAPRPMPTWRCAPAASPASPSTGCSPRKGRFDGLGAFEDAHIRIDADDFTLDGFDVAPGKRSKPLVMTFKKPDEVVGNHIAKYQSVKLAKMLMAYDFDRQMNPFVELGGFLFTFIGDGAPGTGKTTLIQMIAGLVNGYCQVAGYPFVYENFGVDQISSYQGKSGQNCRQFIDNVLNPRAIGFGTVDDIDQVAAKRSDDRASAGQHEITGVLDGGLLRRHDRRARQLLLRHVLQLSGECRRRAAPARRRPLAGRRAAEPRRLHRHLRAARRQEPQDRARRPQALRRAGDPARRFEAYESYAMPHEEGLFAVYERFMKEKGQPKTMADVGTYLHMIKEAEPRFTGRAIKNVTDAIKMRAMDIELPDDWFEKPETFMHKSLRRRSAR